MLFRAILDIIAHVFHLVKLPHHFLVQLYPNYTQKHVITYTNFKLQCDSCWYVIDEYILFFLRCVFKNSWRR